MLWWRRRKVEGAKTATKERIPLGGSGIDYRFQKPLGAPAERQVRRLCEPGGVIVVRWRQAGTCRRGRDTGRVWFCGAPADGARIHGKSTPGRRAVSGRRGGVPSAKPPCHVARDRGPTRWWRTHCEHCWWRRTHQVPGYGIRSFGGGVRSFRRARHVLTATSGSSNDHRRSWNPQFSVRKAPPAFGGGWSDEGADRRAPE